VHAEALELITVRLRAEDKGLELDRLEAAGEVLELVRKFASGSGGDVGRLVWGVQEQERTGQAVSRLAAGGRLACDLVRGAIVLRRGRQRGAHLGGCELEQELKAKVWPGRLVQGPPQGRDRRVEVTL